MSVRDEIPGDRRVSFPRQAQVGNRSTSLASLLSSPGPGAVLVTMEVRHDHDVPALVDSGPSADHELLERLAGVVEEWHLEALRPQLAACRRQLAAGAGLEVAVYGRFKAGKSSFLNHLVGRAVLPVGVVPLTAVITRLMAGEVPRARVHFLDGQVRAISLDAIAQYVSEKANPNNQKQVAAVEVELPELQSLAPLRFVDTPGLGSALAHNTAVALDWLPNTSAALVAIGSDAPLSERDLNLLNSLREYTPQTAVLLTKADLLDAAQQQEVLAFVKQQLASLGDGQWPVFLYSTRTEGTGYKNLLLQQWLLPLQAEAGRTGARILRHKLESLRRQALDYLRVALAAASQAESARQALRSKLQEEQQQLGLFRHELEALTRQWSGRSLELALERLQPVQKELQSRLAAEMANHFREHKGAVSTLLPSWRQWVHDFLHRELTKVSQQNQALFQEPVAMAAAHLSRSLRAFHGRLADHVRAALGVQLSPQEIHFEVHPPAAPPLDVNYAFDPAYSAFCQLPPAFIFRRPLEKVLLRKAGYEVEKNLSRLAADWNERVCAVIENLRRQTEEAAGRELQSLQQMLEQRRSDAPQLQRQIHLLAGGLKD